MGLSDSALPYDMRSAIPEYSAARHSAKNCREVSRRRNRSWSDLPPTGYCRGRHACVFPSSPCPKYSMCTITSTRTVRWGGGCLAFLRAIHLNPTSGV
jgi:hypothetical protein